MADGHCGRREKDPWWTSVKMETEIALYHGVKDAALLSEVLQDE